MSFAHLFGLPLHVYRCSFCNTVATSSVKTSDTPLKCCACRRIMAYQYTEKVTTDYDVALLKRGIVFNPFDAPYCPQLPPSTERRCDAKGCHEYRDKAAMIHLAGVGRFCSEACADRELAERDAFMGRLEQLYEKQPWLRPAAKEVTHG